MKSHELFQQMSPALANELFSYLQREQKPVLKTMVQSLAQQRRLRQVFIERKPPEERHAWLKNALSRKQSNTFAAHLLQTWLLGAQKEMLCDFLDAAGVKHDPDGTVDEMPEAPTREKLDEIVSQLLAKYPAESLAVYLHCFHDMDTEVTWPLLGELLREDERLRVGISESKAVTEEAPATH